MRRLVPALLALAVAGLSACADSDSQPAATPSKTAVALAVQAPANVAVAGLLAAALEQPGGLPGVSGAPTLNLDATPDALRAAITSGNAQVAALPSTVAANLYNRGVKLRVLAVAGAGLLHVVGPRGAPLKLTDLRGKTLLVPFRGDLPDLVVRALLTDAGLKPGQDIKLQYASALPEAAAAVASGRATYAVLPEPFATIAIGRSRDGPAPLAPRLSLDKAWDSAFGGNGGIPATVIVVDATLASTNPDLVDALRERLELATRSIRDDDKLVARLAQRFKTPLPITQQVLAQSPEKLGSIADAQGSLERFYEVVLKLEPAAINGRAPDAGFYAVAQG